MSPVDAARLRALAEKATPGPSRVSAERSISEMWDAQGNSPDFNYGQAVLIETRLRLEVAARELFQQEATSSTILILLDAHKLARDFVADAAESMNVSYAVREEARRTLRDLDALVTPEVTP